MACACGKNKARFDVVMPDGKVVYTSSNKHTAEAIAKRYDGARVADAGSTKRRAK